MRMYLSVEEAPWISSVTSRV